MYTDPVFFLHHGQVDRLWWLWQQQDPDARLYEFHGPTADVRHHPESQGASLNDILGLGGLVQDRQVRDYMDARTENLCYRY